MNKKNILIGIFIVFFFVILITIFIIYKESNLELKAAGNVDNIVIKDNRFDININYPITEYNKLNEEITNTINKYREEFYIELKDVSDKSYYTMDINYKEYSYQNYISIIFYVETYTGGAHPSHQIKTINYNYVKNELITIQTLVNNNTDILNTLSILSRDYLGKIKIFSDEGIYSMMILGTEPTIDNFKNFIFTSDGLMIIFERYQIASYYFGEYNITIPYEKLKINI